MTSCPPGCGICCDPVYIKWNPADMAWFATDAIDQHADPATDEGWAEDWSRSWSDENRELAIAMWRNPDHPRRRNARFVVANWTPRPERDDGWWAVDCATFDQHTRSCTAYEDRPTICSGYPWYGKEPDPDVSLNRACAFQADVRTTLPIAAINGKPVRP